MATRRNHSRHVHNRDKPFSSITSANSGIFVPDDALDVYAYNVSVGVYATDTLALTERLAVTVSGRYNHTHSVIADLSGLSPDLNGEHRFNRFNPAAGITYQWSPAVNFYGGHSESTRAPTARATCPSARLGSSSRHRRAAALMQAQHPATIAERQPGWPGREISWSSKFRPARSLMPNVSKNPGVTAFRWTRRSVAIL